MYLSRQQVGSDASPLHIAAGWSRLGVCPGWMADKYPFRRGSVRSECRSSARAGALYPRCAASPAASANRREAGRERVCVCVYRARETERMMSGNGEGFARTRLGNDSEVMAAPLEFFSHSVV